MHPENDRIILKNNIVEFQHLTKILQRGIIITFCGTGYLNGLLRSLSDAGLVITQPGEYPVVTLTALGDKVMRGERAYRLVWPDPHAGRPEVGLEDHDFDGGLYTLLRDLRTRIAREEDSPPYVVFSNKTLEAFVRYQPSGHEEAMKIPGVGLMKAQRYLEPFLDAIKVWRAQAVAGSAAPGEVVPSGDGRLLVGCGAGALELLDVQRAGGRRITAREFLQRLPPPPSLAG